MTQYAIVTIIRFATVVAVVWNSRSRDSATALVRKKMTIKTIETETRVVINVVKIS